MMFERVLTWLRRQREPEAYSCECSCPEPLCAGAAIEQAILDLPEEEFELLIAELAKRQSQQQ